MNKIFSILSIVFLLFLVNTFASVSVDSGFENGSNTATIEYGQNANFWVSIWSDTDNEEISISLRDSKNAKISEFENNLNFNGLFESDYLITKNDYLKPGEYKILVYAKDKESDVLKDDLRLIVKEKPTIPAENHAPVIQDIPNQEITKGNTFTYKVNASDEDKDNLIYLVQGPGGMTINNVGTIEWKADTAGTHGVRVIVSDSKISATKEFNINVKEKPTIPAENHAPVIQDIPNQEITKGNTFTYKVNASDEDKDNLSYNLLHSPMGMVIHTDGEIVWNADTIGTHNIQVSASDGKVSTSKGFVLTVKEKPTEPPVKENHAPVIQDIPNQEITKGNMFTYKVSASDEDKDNLTYVLLQNPNYMVISPEGEIGWKANTAGEYNVQVGVSDGKITVSKGFKLTVKEITQPPAEPEKPKGTTCLLSADFNYDGKVDFGDFLIFAGSGFGSKKGDAKFESRADLNRDDKINFEDFILFVKNVGKETCLTIKFYNARTGEELKDRIEINENQDFRINVEMKRDGDIGILNFDKIESDLEGIGRYDVGFTGKTNYETVKHPDTKKEFKIKITRESTFREFGVDKIEKEFTVVVKDVNRAPKNLNVNKIQPSGEIKETDLIKLQASGTDEDGDALKFNVDKYFSVENNILSWQTGYNDAGNYKITVTAEDGFGANANTEFDFSIKDTNRLGDLIVPAEIRVQEGKQLGGLYSEFEGNKVEFEVSSSADPDGDANTIELVSKLPKGAKFENNKITWNLRKNQGKQEPYEFKFRLSDGKDSIEKSAKVYVEDNVLPFYPTLFEAESKPEAILSLINSVSGENLVLVSAENSYDNQDYKHELEYRYDFNSDGTYDTEWSKDVTKSRVNKLYPYPISWAFVKLQVRDTDGMVNEVSGQLKLRDIGVGGVVITTTNQAPAVSDIPDQTITAGQIFNTINLDSFVSDADNGDSEITWSISGNSQLTINIVNRIAIITYPAGFIGAETVTFTAKDPQGASASDNVIFRVNAVVQPPVTVNQAPAVSDIPDQTITAGQIFNTINLDSFVSDADNGDSEITWSFSGNNQVNVNIVSRIATISYASGFIGAETIAFTARDPSGASASDNVIFRVNAVVQPPVTVNQAPAVSDIPDQTITAGQTFSNIDLDSYVSDLDNADSELTWSISGNSQVSVNIINRIAAITYPTGFIGAETVTFTAKDPQGATASDSAIFRINAVVQPPVMVNHNPVLNIKRNNVNIGSAITINENEELRLVLEGSDTDNDGLRYEAGNAPASSSLTGNVFAWNPLNTEGGKSYVIVFRVYDLDQNGALKGGSDTKTLAVTVNDNLEPKVKEKKKVNHLELGNIIVNDWNTVNKGDLFDIDAVVKNKGNVNQKDIRVSIEIPQLDYFQRSSLFNVNKKKEEIKSFSVQMPSEFNDDTIFAIVTVSNNKDEDSQLMAFLVEA